MALTRLRSAFPQCYSEAAGEAAAQVLSALYEEARAATTTLWWTGDGWTEFMDWLESRGEAIRALRNWWEEVLGRGGRGREGNECKKGEGGAGVYRAHILS